MLKAIAKDPRDRYATARALAADLRRFAHHKPIVARRPRLIERTWRRLIHRPRVTIAVMAGLATVVAGLTTGLLIALNARKDMGHALAIALTARNEMSQALEEKTTALDNSELSLSLATHAIDQLFERIPRRSPPAQGWEPPTEFVDALLRRLEDQLRQDDSPWLRRQAAKAYQLSAAIREHSGAAGRSAQLLEQVSKVFDDDPDYHRELNRSLLMGLRLKLGDERDRWKQRSWSLRTADDRDFWLRPFQHPVDRMITRARKLITRFPKEGFVTDLYVALSLKAEMWRHNDRSRESLELLREIDELRKRITWQEPERSIAHADLLADRAHLILSEGEGSLEQALSFATSAVDELTYPSGDMSSSISIRRRLLPCLAVLGQVRIRMGVHRAAADVAARLLRDFPGHLEAHAAAISILADCAGLAADQSRDLSLAQGYRQQVEDLLKHVERAPLKSDDGINNLAWFLVTCQDLSLRDPALALRLVQSAGPRLETHWRPDYARTRALANYRTGNSQEALAIIAEVVNHPQRPRVPMDYLIGAIALLDLGRREHAFACYAQAGHLYRKYIGATDRDSDALFAEAKAKFTEEELARIPDPPRYGVRE